MSENSESPSRKGLAVFTIGRNKWEKNKSSTTNSLRSSGSEANLRKTGSFESTRRDTHGEDGEPSGVKKLVGKTLGRRSRKKQERANEQQASEEVERGRSIADRGILTTMEDHDIGVGHGRHDNNGEDQDQNENEDNDADSRSSMITYDEEEPALLDQ